MDGRSEAAGGQLNSLVHARCLGNVRMKCDVLHWAMKAEIELSLSLLQKCPYNLIYWNDYIPSVPSIMLVL